MTEITVQLPEDIAQGLAYSLEDFKKDDETWQRLYKKAG
jgi:hypothetical protein